MSNQSCADTCHYSAHSLRLKSSMLAPVRPGLTRPDWYSNGLQGSPGQLDFVPFEIEFRERELLEQRIQEATQTQLERLRELRKSRLAPLFNLWKAQGRSGIEALLLLKPTRQNAASAVFSPYLLPCGYSFL